MNLTLANSHPDNEPVWEISYRASEFFNIKNLTDYEGIHKFVEQINTEDSIYIKTCRSFFADGPQIEMYCDKPSKLHFE